MDITNKQHQAIIGAAAVVVVLLIGWWLFTKPADNVVGTNTGAATSTGTTGSATSTGATAANTVPVSAGEEVHVDDQPAGDSVRVAEARLSRTSWLAVRDTMRIYGAARANPPAGGGTMLDIAIPLLRNTEAGKTYTVVAYADDGDGVFDFKKDALVEGLDDTFTALHGD